MKRWMIALVCAGVAAGAYGQDDDWMDGFDDLFGDETAAVEDSAAAVADEGAAVVEEVTEDWAELAPDAAAEAPAEGSEDWSDLEPEAVEAALNDAEGFAEETEADTSAWLDDTLGIELPAEEETAEATMTEEEIFDLDDFPEVAEVEESPG